MRATLVLANYTGWPPSEIDAMDVELFAEYVTMIPNRR